MAHYRVIIVGYQSPFTKWGINHGTRDYLDGVTAMIALRFNSTNILLYM